MAYDAHRPSQPEPPVLDKQVDPRMQYPASYKSQSPDRLESHRCPPPSVVPPQGYVPNGKRFSVPMVNEDVSPPYFSTSRARASSSTRPEPLLPGSLPSQSIPANAIHDSPSPVHQQQQQNQHQPRADSSSYPPELVAQITEDVIKRLKASSMETPAMGPPPMVRSPSRSRATSQTNSDTPSMQTRDVYTPPSPRPKPEFTAYGSPPRHNSVPGASPVPSMGSQSPRETRPFKEPPPARHPERGPPSPEHQDSVRPQPARAPTDKEETPLDRTWGQLFDPNGKPTVRLGQFLRGLANHLIVDFEPKCSLVVTPTKMAKYYELCALQSETGPWKTMFRELPSPKLSRLYQELECQHHLVQDRHDNVPAIPGLTPHGFAHWMTILIRARPNDEVERLQKAVLEMPISNADDQKERFPKEISRRLFPKVEDRKLREKIEKAFAPADLPGPPKTPRPEHSRQDHANSPAPSSKIERERKPYATAPTDAHDNPAQSSLHGKIERERAPYSGTSDSASDNLPPPPGGIERERKPYSVHPGGGKAHDGELKPNPAAAGRATSATGTRTQSDATRQWENPPPDASRHSRTSSNVNPPPRGRRRSPSISKGASGARRSDPDILGYPDTGGPVDIGIDSRRWSRASEPNRPDWGRHEQSPSRRFDNTRDADRFERMHEPGVPRRGYEEDYYRPGGGRGAGNAYDYSQPYPPNYR